MSKSKSLAWIVWMIGSIFYAYQYVLRVMPNIMMNDIMTDFQMDAVIFGQYAGIYYIGYSLVHLPVGIMLDRFGPRRILTGCILMSVIGLIPVLLADHWIYPVLGRALMGIGSSAAILGAFKIIRMTFSDQHFTRMLSLSVTIGLIGAIYGGGPVATLCTLIGYKGVIQIFVAVGIALAALTFFLVPEIKGSPSKNNVWKDMKIVFTNKRVIFICLSAGLMLGPLEGFADVWGTAFLGQAYGFEGKTSTYLPSIIYVGMCVGAPILGFIAEKTGYYIGSIIASGVVMFLVFAGLVGGVLDINSMSIGFALVGVCCAYQILAIYKASTYVSEDVAGLTTAAANMIIMIFGSAFHTVIGFVVKNFGGPQESLALTYGVGVIPAALMLGMIGFITISYQENKGTKSNTAYAQTTA